MLGKKLHRVGGFSICHATILAAFIVVAHMMIAAKAERDLQMSRAAIEEPEMSTDLKRCESLVTSIGEGQPCGHLVRLIGEPLTIRGWIVINPGIAL